MATNSDVIKNWATQTTHRGCLELHSKHLWFNHESLYSYSTLIARLVADINGNYVALLTNKFYSHTTQQHKAEAFWAARNAGIVSFEVPQSAVDQPLSSDAVLEYYEEQALQALGKHLRARKNKIWWYDQANEALKRAKEFADRFAVAYEAPDLFEVGMETIDLTNPVGL